MTVNDTDKFLVNRNGDSFHLEAQNLMAQLEDDDLMLVNRKDDQGVWHSYKVTGAEIKESLGNGSGGGGGGGIGDNTVAPGEIYAGGAYFGGALAIRPAPVLAVKSSGFFSGTPFTILGTDDKVYRINSALTEFEFFGNLPAVIDAEARKNMLIGLEKVYCFTNESKNFTKINISDGSTDVTLPHPRGIKFLGMTLGDSENSLAFLDEDGKLWREKQNALLEFSQTTTPPMVDFSKDKGGKSCAGVGTDGKLYNIVLNSAQDNIDSIGEFAGYEGRTDWKKVAIQSAQSASLEASIHAITEDGEYHLLKPDGFMGTALDTNFPAGESAVDIQCCGYSVFVVTASGKCFQGGAKSGDVHWFSQGPYVTGNPPTASTWAELSPPAGKKFQAMTEPQQAGHISFVVLDA